jgi:hypothetical protein
MKAFFLFALTLLLLAAGGCKAVPRASTDPVKLGVIPPECRVVAQTNNANDPLLFIPNWDGAVYYVADDDLLATFAVRAGERIELNGGDRSNAYKTEIRVDGKSVFSSNSRAGKHRFYFWRKA